MAALVSERFSSSGKLKVQLMVNLNFILHACNLCATEVQIRLISYNSVSILFIEAQYVL